MAEPVAARAQDDLFAEHVELFHDCYGPGEAPRLFFSPGRVNLFGGHLDYNGGPVMPTAIDRGTFLAVRRRTDRKVLLACTQDSRGLEVELDNVPTSQCGRWVDYPLGVLLDLVVRARGQGRLERLEGLEFLFGGDLPVGAGLSSSASICVGTACALDVVWDLELGAAERVRSALRAERGFVGVQCGIMDPFAVGYAKPGHLLWLDCKDESFEHLPLDPDRLAVLVADTGVTRGLAASEFNRRVAQCRAAFEKLAPHAPGATVLRDVTPEVLAAHGDELDPVERRRAEHVVGEVARTFAARESLLLGDIEAMAAQMFRAHDSLRSLYEVSCPELDCLVDAAHEAPGALGSRLTGAGFGGCTVALVERGAVESVRAVMTERYSAAFGRVPQIEVYGGDEGPREWR
jgi:galactokinase